MRPRFIIVAAIALNLVSVSLPLALAQDSNSPAKTSKHSGERAGAASDVVRGKYLVESVAMCGQCHTPRDSKGNLDRSRWLQGAPVPWLPAKPDPNWPLSAPRIGGTPPANDEDLIKLLTTGVWTSGNHLRLPMPQFRMERSDAEAVVAYLRSLTAKQ
jgi:mono/diheme cytochrome c family protein